MKDDRNYLNKLEVLINVFKTENGRLKILLFKKETEPYKGYWMLPSSLLFSEETIEHCALDTMQNMVGYENVSLYHVNVYSNRQTTPLGRVIGCSMLTLLDNEKAKFERKLIAGFESQWFPIKEIPKMVGDHDKIIKDAIYFLKKRLEKKNILSAFYPNYVSLKELQCFYEELLDISLDRRNFRKKVLNSGLLIQTDERNLKTNGRPATLYKVNSDVDIFFTSD